MSYFFGLNVDEKSKKEILDITRNLKPIFNEFGIPIRWVTEDLYHLTVIHLGDSMPFLRKMYIKYKLKAFVLKPFKIKFNSIKLGISRKYKELIYLDLLEGGDEMRKMFLELRNILSIKNDNNFVPHLTLGRVSKDLTNQEYSNLCKDLRRVSKDLEIKKISFEVKNIDLIKSENGNYTVLMNLTDSASKVL